jgi:hypothetical protein
LQNLSFERIMVETTRGCALAEEEDERLLLTLGEGDTQVEFASLPAFQRWFSSERAQWHWLEMAEPPLNIGEINRLVTTSFDEIASLIEQAKSEAQPVSWLKAHVESRYARSGGRLRYSDGQAGRLILDVNETVGCEAAAFAYAFVLGFVNAGSASKIEHIQGMFALSVPEMARPAELARRLSNERANFKAAQRAGIVAIEAAQTEQDDRFASLLRRGRTLTRRVLRGRVARADAAREAWLSAADEAVSDIHAVKTAFEESMRLQAPVRYWTSKAVAHGKRERWLAFFVIAFFVMAIIRLATAVAFAGRFLLEESERAADERRPEPAALYVLMTGGLAALSTLTFWVGRLLTKLYLSEHHLRNDAHERAVMTTTYLALTRTEKAEQIDRQIILNALFRNSPDGIVKEDGGADLSLQALVARMLARP